MPTQTGCSGLEQLLLSMCLSYRLGINASCHGPAEVGNAFSFMDAGWTDPLPTQLSNLQPLIRNSKTLHERLSSAALPFLGTSLHENPLNLYSFSSHSMGNALFLQLHLDEKAVHMSLS
jgi:hypothetical protein